MRKPSKSSHENNTFYISLEEVLTIHQRMLEVGGGKKGIRDFTLIHSAVERPKATFSGKSLYPTVFLKAAALIQSLIKNHPFDDGNKRTGYFSTIRFLFLNGCELKAKKEQIVYFTLDIDVKKLSLDQIATWLMKHSHLRT